MYVKIGPYKNWWGPYQIADLLQKVGLSEERCEKIGEYLSTTWFSSFCDWIESKKKRKIKIKIHKYDTWSMDHTLALIILPMLKQLKATNHGAQMVDLEDVPQELRFSDYTELSDQGLLDFNGQIVDDTESFDIIQRRWNWVQDEMIWSFQQILKDDDYLLSCEDQRLHNARMNRGLQLFGKYYRGLWD